MTKRKQQTIYVKRHDGKKEKIQIPLTLQERDIQFVLNSKFGEQGWESYKIGRASCRERV